MSLATRRGFLTASGQLVVGTVALAAVGAQASDEHEHEHGASGKGLMLDAEAENLCGTCQFWGGMRLISEDGKVIAQSIGWCNNPNSPNHRKLTMADHAMRKAGIWKRWLALS